MSNKIYRFTASWCQPCKMLAMNLEGADLGVPIEVVDIDLHEDLAASYKIRSVPTLVYLKDNKEAGRIQGVQTVLALEDWAHKLAA